MSLIRTILILCAVIFTASLYAAEKKKTSGVLEDLGRDLKKSAASVEQDLEQAGKKVKKSASEAGDNIDASAKKTKAEASASAKKAKEKAAPKKKGKKEDGVKGPNPISAAFTKVKNKGKNLVSGVRNKFSKKDEAPAKDKKPAAPAPAPDQKKK